MNPSILAALAKYGGATIIVVYLAWQLAQSIPVIEKDIVEIKITQKAVAEEHKEIKQVNEKGGDMMIKMMRSICLNTSKTKEETQRCN